MGWMNDARLFATVHKRSLVNVLEPLELSDTKPLLLVTNDVKSLLTISVVWKPDTCDINVLDL